MSNTARVSRPWKSRLFNLHCPSRPQLTRFIHHARHPSLSMQKTSKFALSAPTPYKSSLKGHNTQISDHSIIWNTRWYYIFISKIDPILEQNYKLIQSNMQKNNNTCHNMVKHPYDTRCRGIWYGIYLVFYAGIYQMSSNVIRCVHDM